MKNFFLIIKLSLLYFTSVILLSCDDSDEQITTKMPVLEILQTDSLHFDYFDTHKTFMIRNADKNDIEWEIHYPGQYFTFSKSNGTLSPGKMEKLDVSIDRTQMISQHYHSVITIYSNDFKLGSFPISADHYINPYIIPKEDLIDAAYDRNHDYIIMVFDSPAELIKLDPVSLEKEVLDLVLPPQALSVSVDGKFAAVGHNGWFSYINLQNMETVQVYPIATDVFDIVLAPNNWVYATSVNNHLMRCVNLANGQQTIAIGEGPFTTPGVPIQLHPTGNFLYAASTNNPSSLRKYSIIDGTASFLYRYPYHGTYQPGNKLWLCEEGKRIITHLDRFIFNATDQQETDMIYAGQLEGQNRIINLDHSSAAGLVYAILETQKWNNIPDTLIRIYEDTFMNYTGSISVPKYLTANHQGIPVFVNARGYYVFFNNDGRRFYTLQKPVETPLINNHWALGTGTVE